MELFHRFKPHTLAVATLLLMCSNSWAANPNQQTEDEWKFTLKNAYINRDFDNDVLKDTGSWSQAASLFYKSKMHDTPLVIADKPITIGADASVQYAVRLSSDKHVADTVLPFNKETQSQASDFLKYGATLKLGYDKTLLSVGELWLDLPVTAVDASRQLLAS
uniref:OprD family outer membrane porin n=1 Tax=Acinetobacter pittii TaxID=48296 RepID=UPI00192BC25E